MNQCKNLIRNWRDEEALKRYQFIAPVLDPSLDEAERIQKREEAANAADLSVRTLYRYEKGYREQGFEGLKPSDRKGMTSKRLPENFDVLFADAVQLKKEVPKRSVNQIIEILELEGKAPPGALKRSTLEDHLYEAGFGVRQMQSILIRAKQAGCITTAVYEEHQKWISKSGLRKDEKSGLTPEYSTLFEKLVVRAVSEDMINMNKASELLELPYGNVQQLCGLEA